MGSTHWRRLLHVSTCLAVWCIDFLAPGFALLIDHIYRDDLFGAVQFSYFCFHCYNTWIDALSSLGIALGQSTRKRMAVDNGHRRSKCSLGLNSHSDDHKYSEQGGGLNGYPRHATCFLASLGAGVAPRAAVSHLGRSTKYGPLLPN